MNQLVVSKKVHFHRGHRSQKHLNNGKAKTKPSVPGRVPRLARLMALAMRIDGLIREGTIIDYAEAARLGHVTRSRMSQIMNLLHLAPDLQETILFLPRVTSGRDPITEREVRSIVAIYDWRKQRKMWSKLANDS